MRLQGQVALITGGGSGIGRSIALRFAREGAGLVVVGRTPSTIENVTAEIGALGREALGVRCDVCEDTAVREMVRSAQDRFGKIDILVNNAGYFGSMHPLQETPDAEWELSLRMNLTSVFYVTRAVLPGMISRRSGSILMISSVAAKAAYPFGAPYTAAKAGLLGLTRAVAAEAGPFGIRVNALCPGVVQGTAMHEKVSRELHRIAGLSPEQRLEAARASALLRQLPTPEEVADAALFFASPESALITGQTMNVDGGTFTD